MKQKIYYKTINTFINTDNIQHKYAADNKRTQSASELAFQTNGPGFDSVVLQSTARIRTRFVDHKSTTVTTRPLLNDFLVINNKLYGRPPQYAPAPLKLTFDL